MASAGKTRSINWTDNELERLVLLIEPVVGIIEDKRSGGNAHKKKKEAWQKVIDGFIAIFGTTNEMK